MGFLFKSKKKEKIIAIFDIGSGSVGGSIVRIPIDDKDGVPTILKTVRNEIRFHESFDFDSFLKDMIFTLSVTSNSLFYKNAGAPEEIVCVLASPWYFSDTKNIKIEQDKYFNFTKKIADDLINKEISNFIALYKNEYGSVDNIPEVIEKYVMSISMDGKINENPINDRCKSLEMDMFVSLASKNCLDKIREVLFKTFHNNNITFSSFTFSSYLAVRDRYIKTDSYLLVDISGEITDIGVVVNGILKSTLSFPFGKKTFFKYMCTKLEIELRDAKEIFRLYNNENLSSDMKAKIIPLFNSIENSWGESFDQCLKTLPKDLVIPNNIYITADDDLKKWYYTILKNKQEFKSITLQRYNLISLEGVDFLNVCNVDEGYCDPFLIIEAISFMRKMNK